MSHKRIDAEDKKKDTNPHPRKRRRGLTGSSSSKPMEAEEYHRTPKQEKSSSESSAMEDEEASKIVLGDTGRVQKKTRKRHHRDKKKTNVNPHPRKKRRGLTAETGSKTEIETSKIVHGGEQSSVMKVGRVQLRKQKVRRERTTREYVGQLKNVPRLSSPDNKTDLLVGIPEAVQERSLDAAPSTNLGDWDVIQVADWIAKVEKAPKWRKYAKKFEEEEIAGETLLSLKESDLLDLEVSKFHAKTLLRKLETLKSAKDQSSMKDPMEIDDDDETMENVEKLEATLQCGHCKTTVNAKKKVVEPSASYLKQFPNAKPGDSLGIPCPSNRDGKSHNLLRTLQATLQCHHCRTTVTGDNVVVQPGGGYKESKYGEWLIPPCPSNGDGRSHDLREIIRDKTMEDVKKLGPAWQCEHCETTVNAKKKVVKPSASYLKQFPNAKPGDSLGIPCPSNRDGKSHDLLRTLRATMQCHLCGTTATGDRIVVQPGGGYKAKYGEWLIPPCHSNPPYFKHDLREMESWDYTCDKFVERLKKKYGYRLQDNPQSSRDAQLLNKKAFHFRKFVGREKTTEMFQEQVEDAFFFDKKKAEKDAKRKKKAEEDAKRNLPDGSDLSDPDRRNLPDGPDAKDTNSSDPDRRNLPDGSDAKDDPDRRNFIGVFGTPGAGKTRYLVELAARVRRKQVKHLENCLVFEVTFNNHNQYTNYDLNPVTQEAAACWRILHQCLGQDTGKPNTFIDNRMREVDGKSMLLIIDEVQIAIMKDSRFFSRLGRMLDNEKMFTMIVLGACVSSSVRKAAHTASNRGVDALPLPWLDRKAVAQLFDFPNMSEEWVELVLECTGYPRALKLVSEGMRNKRSVKKTRDKLYKATNLNCPLSPELLVRALNPFVKIENSRDPIDFKKFGKDKTWVDLEGEGGIQIEEGRLLAPMFSILSNLKKLKDYQPELTSPHSEITMRDDNLSVHGTCYHALKFLLKTANQVNDVKDLMEPRFEGHVFEKMIMNYDLVVRWLEQLRLEGKTFEKTLPEFYGFEDEVKNDVKDKVYEFYATMMKKAPTIPVFDDPHEKTEQGRDKRRIAEGRAFGQPISYQNPGVDYQAPVFDPKEKKIVPTLVQVKRRKQPSDSVISDDLQKIKKSSHKRNHWRVLLDFNPHQGKGRGGSYDEKEKEIHVSNRQLHNFVHPFLKRTHLFSGSCLAQEQRASSPSWRGWSAEDVCKWMRTLDNGRLGRKYKIQGNSVNGKKLELIYNSPTVLKQLVTDLGIKDVEDVDFVLDEVRRLVD